MMENFASTELLSDLPDCEDEEEHPSTGPGLLEGKKEGKKERKKWRDEVRGARYNRTSTSATMALRHAPYTHQLQAAAHINVYSGLFWAARRCSSRPAAFVPLAASSSLLPPPRLVFLERFTSPRFRRLRRSRSGLPARIHGGSTSGSMRYFTRSASVAPWLLRRYSSSMSMFPVKSSGSSQMPTTQSARIVALRQSDGSPSRNLSPRGTR